MEPDIVTRLFQFFIWSIERMDARDYLIMPRLALTLLLVLFAVMETFRQGNRRRFIQFFVAIFATFISLLVPVYFLYTLAPVIKTTIFVVSMILLIFLPALISQFLVPEARYQRRVRWGIYGGIGVLIFLNLIS